MREEREKERGKGMRGNEGIGEGVRRGKDRQ